MFDNCQFSVEHNLSRTSQLFRSSNNFCSIWIVEQPPVKHPNSRLDWRWIFWSLKMRFYVFTCDKLLRSKTNSMRLFSFTSLKSVDLRVNKLLILPSRVFIVYNYKSACIKMVLGKIYFQIIFIVGIQICDQKKFYQLGQYLFVKCIWRIVFSPFFGKKWRREKICFWFHLRLETMSVYFEGQILINSFWRNYKLKKKKPLQTNGFSNANLLPSSFTLSELNHQYWSADKNHWNNNQAWLLDQCNSPFRFKQSRPE
jgi:hypothetical protein